MKDSLFWAVANPGVASLISRASFANLRLSGYFNRILFSLFELDVSLLLK